MSNRNAVRNVEVSENYIKLFRALWKNRDAITRNTNRARFAIRALSGTDPKIAVPARAEIRERRNAKLAILNNTKKFISNELNREIASMRAAKVAKTAAPA